MEFKSTYEDACAYLKISTERPTVSGYSEEELAQFNADHDLKTILAANNKMANKGKKWKANVADTKQKKWYPLFEVIQDADAPLGFRLAFFDCYCDDAYAFLGARHAAINSEVAEFMGKNRPDLYVYTLS